MDGWMDGCRSETKRMEGVLGWLGSVLLLSVLVSSSLFSLSELIMSWGQYIYQLRFW